MAVESLRGGRPAGIGARAVGLLALLALAWTVAWTVAGTGAAHGQTPDVAVTLSEWLVTPAPDSASAGELSFAVQNRGRLAHELIVIASDATPDALPLTSDGASVDESQVVVAARLPGIAAGAPVTLNATLAPGSYVLICNLPGHYSAGMRGAFTVTPAQNTQPVDSLPATGDGGLAAARPGAPLALLLLGGAVAAALAAAGARLARR